MQKFPVIIDIETKHTFREFDEPRKLGVTVAGIYDFADRRGQVFVESELRFLFAKLEKASYVMGYNSRGFDMPVLQAYYPGDLSKLPQFDLLEDIRLKIGKRIGLNDVVFATLGVKKSGHGLMAIDYYKEGKWEELKSYCLDDVMITKKLFDFGVKNREIFYLNETGKVPIRVAWGKYLEESGADETELTLPF